MSSWLFNSLLGKAPPKAPTPSNMPQEFPSPSMSDVDDIENEHEDDEISRQVSDDSSAVNGALASTAPNGAVAARPASTVPGAAVATRILNCPCDFLTVKTGLGPTGIVEAAELWMFRKDRPLNCNAKDPVAPNGAKMMQEIEMMRTSLKDHVTDLFMQGAEKMAEAWKLKMPKTNTTPVTLKDFAVALGALKRTEGSLKNEMIAYMACHHFHHQRVWLTKAVDGWCEANNIRIDAPKKTAEEVDGNVVRTRSSGDKGGFGTCARMKKNELVKRLTTNMMARAGWKVAVCDNSKKKADRNCEKITLHCETTGSDFDAWLITEKCVQEATSGEEKPKVSATRDQL